MRIYGISHKSVLTTEYKRTVPIFYALEEAGKPVDNRMPFPRAVQEARERRILLYQERAAKNLPLFE